MGGLMSLATALGKSGFITWVAKDTAEIIGSAGLGWIASFLIVILFYTYSHYCFASVTARISAMYAAFVAVAAACGTPALMAALTFGFFATARSRSRTTAMGAVPSISVPATFRRANGGATALSFAR